MWIDTHCHLDAPEFEADRAQVRARARAAGVGLCVWPAVQAADFERVRAGAREQVTELSKSEVAKIAYVSCNPSSFARDAKMLIAAGYKLQRIWPVGQFRWSTHVELAGEFTRQ